MSKNLTLNGEAVAASQEGVLVTELFLNDNYRFRRNVLNGKVEFLILPEGEGAKWRPLTTEALNRQNEATGLLQGDSYESGLRYMLRYMLGT